VDGKAKWICLEYEAFGILVEPIRSDRVYDDKGRVAMKVHIR